MAGEVEALAVGVDGAQKSVTDLKGEYMCGGVRIEWKTVRGECVWCVRGVCEECV